MWKELEQGRGSPFESLHRRKNGSPFPVEVSARIAELNGAKVVLSVVRDITERKRVEQAQRNLEESFMEVQEQERKRIARELHDETAQSMAALLAKLRSAEDSSTLEQAQERLKGLREHVRTAIDEVRRLAQRLQPKNLEDLGLPFALEQCAADYRKTYGLRVNMEMPGLRESGDLSTAVALALFRSLQEALTNVAKHAGATAVDIVVERRTDNILAIVEDNGCGFDANAGSPGLGLYGIRQRLSLLGGDLSIESEPGRGTSIYIQVPVECVRHD
jgi:signal transduction histidine kinase